MGRLVLPVDPPLLVVVLLSDVEDVEIRRLVAVDAPGDRLRIEVSIAYLIQYYRTNLLKRTV